MLAPPSAFPMHHFFPYNRNKPTFVSSCSKLLLSVWATLSNQTVRGSMKFSNSSSSSPTGKETRTNQQKHHLCTCLEGSGSEASTENLTDIVGTSRDIQEQKPELWHIFTELKRTQIVDSTQLVSKTGSCPHSTPFSFLCFSFLSQPTAFVHCPTRIFT